MAIITETITNRTTPSAATATLPSPFSSRYEIRLLTEKDIAVATAIVLQANFYNSPIWPICYPEGQAQRCYAGLKNCQYLIRHQILDGHSFGVFDMQYQYRNAQAEAIGGAVLWDEANADATGEELDAQIDSPMMSVALSYDAHNPLDMEQMAPVMELIPLFGAVYHRLDITDPRDQTTLAVSASGQVLKRNATSTRRGAEGLGVTKKMANWLMAYAREQGYGYINIECLHDKVNHIWTQPTDPKMRGDEVCAFRTEDYTEVDREGRITYPFRGARQRVSRVYLALNT